MSGITRRSFVGIAAATGALAATPALALADDAAEPAASTDGGIEVGVPVDAPATTEDVDVVVVGSGIGGFFASMIAKE